MKDFVCMRISTDDRVEMLDTFFINYYALLQFYMAHEFRWNFNKNSRLPAASLNNKILQNERNIFTKYIVHFPHRITNEM